MRWWIGTLLVGMSCAAGAADVLHRGNGPEPDSLDIHLAQGLSAHNVLRDLYDGLARAGADGEIRPDAAAEWAWNDDRTRLTITLRPDGRWSDGQPVVANDFVRGWRRAVTPSTGSPYAQVFDAVRNASAISRGEASPQELGIEAPDERTLIVHLNRPASEILHQMVLPAMFPYRGDAADASNGRYSLTTWVPQSHVDLVRNGHHPLASSTAIERVRYHTIEDAEAEMKRFRAGELHITETVPPGKVGWARKNLPEALRIAPYYGSYFFGFNLTRTPFKEAPQVRRALNSVIDRSVLTEKILGAGQIPALGVVPPSSDWPASQTDDIEQSARVARAQSLLRAAGYDQQRPLEVEIRLNSGAQHRRLALAVAAMWKQALGVKTSIVREEWKVFVQNRRSRENTEVFRWGWIGDYRDPLTFLELFESDGALNASGYRSAEFDQLLRQARRAAGADRLTLLRQAEALLLRDDVVIPLYLLRISASRFAASARLARQRSGSSSERRSVAYAALMRVAPYGVLR